MEGPTADQVRCQAFGLDNCTHCSQNAILTGLKEIPNPPPVVAIQKPNPKAKVKGKGKAVGASRPGTLNVAPPAVSRSPSPALSIPPPPTTQSKRKPTRTSNVEVLIPPSSVSRAGRAPAALKRPNTEVVSPPPKPKKVSLYTSSRIFLTGFYLLESSPNPF